MNDSGIKPIQDPVLTDLVEVVTPLSDSEISSVYARRSARDTVTIASAKSPVADIGDGQRSAVPVVDTSKTLTVSAALPKHFSYTVLSSAASCNPLVGFPSTYLLHFSAAIKPSQLRLEYVAGKKPKLILLKTDALGMRFERLGEIPTRASLFGSDKVFLKFPNAPTLFYDSRGTAPEAVVSYRRLRALPSDDEEAATPPVAYILKFARGLTLQDFRPEYRAHPKPTLVLVEANGTANGQVLAEIQLPGAASEQRIFFLMFDNAPTFIYRPEDALLAPLLTQNISFYGDPQGQLQATPEPSHRITVAPGVKREDLTFSYELSPVMALNIQHVRDRGPHAEPLARIVVQTPSINRDLFFLRFENENAYYLRYPNKKPIPAFTYTTSAISDSSQQEANALKSYHISFSEGLKLRHLRFELRNTPTPAFVVLYASNSPTTSEVIGEIALEDARQPSILLEFPDAGVYRFDAQAQTVKPLFSYTLKVAPRQEGDHRTTLLYTFSFFEHLAIDDLKFDYEAGSAPVFTISQVERASGNLERLGTFPIITIHTIQHEIQLRFPDGSSFGFNTLTKQVEPLSELVNPPPLMSSTDGAAATLSPVASPAKPQPAEETAVPSSPTQQPAVSSLGPMIDALSSHPAASALSTPSERRVSPRTAADTTLATVASHP